MAWESVTMSFDSRRQHDNWKCAVQLEENQGTPSAEPGLHEVLERLGNLLQGWSRPEKQVIFCHRHTPATARLSQRNESLP